MTCNGNPLFWAITSLIFHSVYVKIKFCKFVFKGVVRRELYGNISMFGFPIHSYINAVGVSVNGKI